MVDTARQMGRLLEAIRPRWDRTGEALVWDSATEVPEEHKSHTTAPAGPNAGRAMLRHANVAKTGISRGVLVLGPRHTRSQVRARARVPIGGERRALDSSHCRY